MRRWRGLGGDDRGALTGGGHRVIIIKQDWFEPLAHVPFDVTAEHAEKDMRAHPRSEPVMDRAEVQIDRLEAAKGALDPRQPLVGADHVICRQGFILKAGADDKKPSSRASWAMRAGLRWAVKPSSAVAMSKCLASL